MKKLLLLVLLMTTGLCYGQQQSSGGSVQIVNGVNTMAVNGSGAASVNCVSGCGTSSFADEGAFTEGTTSIQLIGGYFKTAFTALTTGQAGAVAMTADRSFYVNLNKVGGAAVALGQTAMASSIPVAIANNQSNLPTNIAQINAATVVTAASGIQKVGIVGNAGGAFDSAQNAAAPANEAVAGCVFNSTLPTITTGNATQEQCDAKGQQLTDTSYWAGSALGAPSNYGTSPGAVLVPGVNAFITNAPTFGAGTALIGKTYPYTSCGTTQVESGSPVGLAALPTVSTALFSSTTCVLSITLANTSATTAFTFSISDNAGTPIVLANAVTINPLETRQYNFPNGAKFNAGLKWNASNAAVTGYVLGIQ